MVQRKTLPLLITGVLTLALAFGMFTYQTVYAQAETPTPGSDTQQNTEKPARGSFRGAGGATREDLAAALGVDIETLQAAQETAAAEALEQAVSAGLITQEQADQLAERGLGRLRFGGKGWLSESGIDTDALLADALGISVEQLQEAYQEAYSASLDRAVENGFLTEEQADLARARYVLGNNANFRSALQSAYEEAVQQAVTDGIITQEQADQILESDSGMGFSGRGWFGDGGFGRHGRGGGRLRGGERLPGDTIPSTPTTTPSDNDV